MAKSYSTVAVIGGGASGILAALTAAQEPARHVLLLEKQQRIGRKLLATGNGRCNLSNWNATPDAYFGSDAAFAAPALQAFSPMDTHRYFSRLGLLTVTEEGGRIYPLSDSSNSVLDVLRFALERAGVDLRCSSSVDGIRRSGSGFQLDVNSEPLNADAVVLACGGAAGAKLGGSTDGYRLAAQLGHRRTALRPSLTRIRTAPEYPRSLKGIRVQAKLCLTQKGEMLATSEGEVQFTETGISGPAGFELSREAACGGNGLLLHLRLLPYEEAGVRTLVDEKINAYPELYASELFTGMLHNRLGRMVVKAAGIPGELPLGVLSETQIAAAVSCCCDFRLPVLGVDGFDAAQVTAGGLETGSFSPETLESRLVSGFFACGEVLDIDGPCGGYNLQWAWASGVLAGRLGA